MNASIRHRGPDDEGFYRGPEVGIGMRRLSIIDIDGGHQPLSNENQTLWLVCNGEIYNFRELRSRLIDRGYRFKTGSDCEVILNAYSEYGDDFVTQLNGMFGFALWDSVRRRMILGRDRLGIKPLYYALQPGSLLFASELKAILEVPGFSVSINPTALESYLSLGYVPGPLTLVENVFKLPPASLLTVSNGNLEVKRYWKATFDADHQRSEEDWSSGLRDGIERAVERQMVSDVPIGAFLSGGIDSSAVVAFMSKYSSSPVKTYSIGFTGGGAERLYNELPYARQIAERFQTDHKEILVQPDVVELLPRLIWHLDEPIADSALLTTYLVAEFAREDVKVILSGVGGDELFGGYLRYLGPFYDEYYRKIPDWLRRNVLRKLAARLPSDRHSKWLNRARLLRAYIASAELPFEERYIAYTGVFSPPTLDRLLVSRSESTHDAIRDAFRSTNDELDPLQKLLCVDLQTQLPDDLLLLTDKATMATSLECRVPLLDHELVEFASRIPDRHRIKNGQLKHLMKRALKDVLPDDILNRPKRGFGAPVGEWIKKQLAPVMRCLLSRDSVENRGLLRWKAVAQTIEAHEANRADHTDHLSALMNLEIWCRLFLDRQTPAHIADSLAQGDRDGNSLRLPSLSVSP